MKYIAYSGAIKFVSGVNISFYPQRIVVFIVCENYIVLLVNVYEEGVVNLFCINGIEEKRIWQLAPVEGYFKFVDFSNIPGNIVAFSSHGVNYLIDVKSGRVLNTFREIGK